VDAQRATGPLPGDYGALVVAVQSPVRRRTRQRKPPKGQVWSKIMGCADGPLRGTREASPLTRGIDPIVVRFGKARSASLTMEPHRRTALLFRAVGTATIGRFNCQRSVSRKCALFGEMLFWDHHLSYLNVGGSFEVEVSANGRYCYNARQ